jgi:hypothetical protein
MRPMSMSTRGLSVPLLALAFALLLAAACGGDDDGPRAAGRLTDPRSVATATPWAEPPEPIILEPGALTPISQGEGVEGGEGEGEGEVQVTPVSPFQITSEESTNLRAAPSTESAVAGTITAGEEKTVTGQVVGEAVEEGNEIWYQLEDGTFVYSGAVKKVEE